MGSKYRLTSSAFDRKGEDQKQEPLRVFFLSVEGNDTEVEYFEQIEAYKKQLKINALVSIEVLHRSKRDTNSAPKHVIELLEEYIELRGNSEDDIINELSPAFKEKYSKEFISTYLNSPQKIHKRLRTSFETDLTLLGYDLNYRKYLMQYNGRDDKFCVVLDRDWQTHSEQNMIDCIKHCQANSYLCYITNPCFEFWLLLHLCDVKIEYASHLEDILQNKTISNNHTYVSKEVSDKAGHKKCNIHFAQNYLPNIDTAIQQANDFEINVNQLIYKIGSNLGNLFLQMRDQKNQ